MADIAPADDRVVTIDLAGDEGAQGGAQAGETLLLPPEGAEIPVLPDDGSKEDELPQRAIRNEDGTITLPLREAVVLRYRGSKGGAVREESFERLTMRRLRGEDMRAFFAASKETQMLVVAARSAGISEMKFNAVWNLMDGADCMDVLEIATFFLERGQKSGR